MATFLPYFIVTMSLVVAIGFLNEKTFKLTYEIALMMMSTVVGVVLIIIGSYVTNREIQLILKGIHVFDLEEFLMEGVLCFMLFSGSCHMKLDDFKRLARPVGILSVVCTLLGAIFYGVLFYAVSKVAGLNFDMPVCLMFGSIVAPTDPIAATSILNKFGLPKDISFLIEGESLLNDGVGVALFVCFSGIVTASENESVLAVLMREVIGAVLIGCVITFICYFFFSKTSDIHRRIFLSMLAVALAYHLCEHFECSGAIASVVCGVLFSTLIDREAESGRVWQLEEYDVFWNILDNLLNSVLYVILGLTFVRILQMRHVVAMSVAAIILNLAARYGSLFVSSLMIGEIPDGYDKGRFCKLLTWGGLRGGLCIALAMSTRTMIDERTYQILLGSTYAIVFFTTVIQGLTMKSVYKRLSKGHGE